MRRSLGHRRATLGTVHGVSSSLSSLARTRKNRSQILLSSRNRVNPHRDRSFSPSSAWPPLSPHHGRKSGSSAKFRESSSCLSSIAPPCAQKFHRTSTCLLVFAPTHFPRNYLISSALAPILEFFVALLHSVRLSFAKSNGEILYPNSEFNHSCLVCP